MKKAIIFLFVLTIGGLSFSNNEEYVLPEDTIRYRIIANSNSIQDQKLKWDINYALIPTIDKILQGSTSAEQSRETIKTNLFTIEETIKNYTSDYKINFGQNYFPKKEYKSVYYPEGEYESLVITLGDGKGDNWWCVMFPPLCLLDAQASDLKDVEYRSYFKKIINKYF